MFDQATLAAIAEMRDVTRETRDDELFLLEHRARLIDEHPGKWAAIYHWELLGTYDALQEVWVMAREMGVPANRITVTFLYRSETPLNLTRMAA